MITTCQGKYSRVLIHFFPSVTSFSLDFLKQILGRAAVPLVGFVQGHSGVYRPKQFAQIISPSIFLYRRRRRTCSRLAVCINHFTFFSTLYSRDLSVFLCYLLYISPLFIYPS